MKNSPQKSIFAWIAVSLAAAACAPPSRTVKLGDPVTVRLQPGGPGPGRSVSSSPTQCSLPVSRLIATSKKFGTVTADLAASVNAQTIFGVDNGESVLKFDEITPITLSASDDWVFQYIGVFGYNCSATSIQVMSAGATEAMSVMSENTQIPMEIDTLGMPLSIGDSSPVPSGTPMAYVTLNLATTTTGSCTGTSVLKLKDGTLLAQGSLGYTFSASGGTAVTSISPLPKNMSYVWTITPTASSSSYDIELTTGSADSQTLDITPPSGFCSSGP